MKHADFEIGLEFYAVGHRWRCTAVSAQTITAMRLEPPANANDAPPGPPVGTMVFDASMEADCHRTLAATDLEAAEDMAAMRDGMRRYRQALAALAKL